MKPTLSVFLFVISVLTFSACSDDPNSGKKTDVGVSDTGSDAGTDTSVEAICGNGAIEGTEACDDGNTEDDDGCDSTCSVEPASCEDGRLNQGETGIDCGGIGCDSCSDGMGCELPRDCVSEVCSANVCAPPACGDGYLNDPSEECDGNGVGVGGQTAVCDADCSLVTCGDGIANTDAGETCDGDGAGTGGETATCNADCTASICGDGIVNATASEACDGDGAGVGGETATCNIDCSIALCGDAYINVLALEACDDGNQDDLDACNNLCVDNVCGDSVVNNGEACDDGNQDDLDACNNLCVDNVCGDTIINNGETCDDGNQDDLDACNNLCVVNFCGDGTINNGEACDDGNQDDLDACNNLCVVNFCGDGTINNGEECEDGNQDDLDGCNNLCVINFCGDGVTNNGEECDDANVNEFDGCNSLCALVPVIFDQSHYELFEVGDFDLSNSTLVFTPGAGTYTFTSVGATSSYPIVPGSGTISTASPVFDDDSNFQQALGFTFPFFASSFTDVFIGSNGYLTFGVGSDEFVVTVAEHFSLPRIAALFADLDPEEFGSGPIVIDVFADRIALTYDGVAEIGGGAFVEVQVVLFDTGVFSITYLNVGVTDGLVGVSEGLNRNNPPSETDFSPPPPVAPGANDLVINEILADPTPLADANCDLIVDGTDDEFVEIVNVSGVVLDLDGVTVSDGVGVKHTFGPTVLAIDEAIVVYGGGIPACVGVRSQIASSGSLGFNNGGDTVTLSTGDAHTYASSTDNQSITRSPELIGSFVDHGSVSAQLISPGFRADGAPF